MNSSDADYINDLNNGTIYMYKYIVCAFYILGNIGNLISALIFSKKSWKKNVCVFYFKTYILCTSLYINSAILGSIFTYGYNIQMQSSNEFLCKSFYYVSFLFPSLSVTVLILASIDRLLISSQNVDTRLYSSKRLAYFSISLSTSVWIIFYVHVLIKFRIQQFSPSLFICYYDSSEVYQNFIIYSIMMINIVVYVLMFVLSIIAIKKVRHIRIVPRQQRNQIRTMTKKDFQLLRCLFVQDIVYIMFSLWVNIDYVYVTVTKNQIRTAREQAIVTFLGNLCTCLYNFSYCVSFFIFIVISKAFRQELKRMIYKIYGKNLVVLREEENRQERIELNVVNVSTIVK
jgi:hypothetical protein